MAPAEPERAIVEEGRRLVLKLAWELSRLHGLQFEELVSIGNVAMAESLNRFDPSLGVAFTTYIWRRVRGAMLDGGAKSRGSLSGRALRAVLGSVSDDLELDRNRDPLTDDDGAVRARIVEKASALAASFALSYASQQMAAGAEAQLLGDESRVSALSRAVASLDASDRSLIDLHYESGMPLAQVAVELGVSYSTARRAHRELLVRLAKRMRMFAG